MVDSVFKTRSLSSIYDEINNVYQADDRPWILGFSGGKDSTCMVQLIWSSSSLPPAVQDRVISYFLIIPNFEIIN